MGNEISTNTEDFESQALLALGARNPIVVEQTDDTVKYSSEDCSGDTNVRDPITYSEYEPNVEVISYENFRNPTIRECVTLNSLAKYVSHIKNFDASPYSPELISAIKEMINSGQLSGDFVVEQSELNEWDAILEWPQFGRYYPLTFAQFEEKYGSKLSTILYNMGLIGTWRAETTMATFVDILTQAGINYDPELLLEVQKIDENRLKGEEFKIKVGMFPITIVRREDYNNLNNLHIDDILERIPDGKYHNEVRLFYEYLTVTNGLPPSRAIGVLNLYVGQTYRETVLFPIRKYNLYRLPQLQTLLLPVDQTLENMRMLWRDILLEYIKKYGLTVELGHMEFANLDPHLIMKFFDINYNYYRLLYDSDELEEMFIILLKTVYRNEAEASNAAVLSKKKYRNFRDNFIHEDDNRIK